MAEEAPRSRLGRGLAALIGDAGDENAAIERARGQRRVPVEFLRPNPRNPRRHFNDMELDELSASIRAKGILQPILVRAVSGAPDAYEIIAGERRWRAAQRAGLHDVPVIVREVDDKEALELAIIENVQRVDLNPLEEALGYEQLIEQFSYTQQDLAQVIGKSRSHVANTLRLLKLPRDVREMVTTGQLTAGHARTLITAEDPATLARQIVAGGLSVRETEALFKRHAAPAGSGSAAPTAKKKDANTRAAEEKLRFALGTDVDIVRKGKGGRIEITFKNEGELDRLYEKLTQ